MCIKVGTQLLSMANCTQVTGRSKFSGYLVAQLAMKASAMAMFTRACSSAACANLALRKVNKLVATNTQRPAGVGVFSGSSAQCNANWRCACVAALATVGSASALRVAPKAAR